MDKRFVITDRIHLTRMTLYVYVIIYTGVLFLSRACVQKAVVKAALISISYHVALLNACPEQTVLLIH